MALQLKSKTNREKIEWEYFIENEDDYASIEHIYPQKAMNKYWRENFKNLTALNRDSLRNVVGNLLPLSKRKNSSLSNMSFDDKINNKVTGVGYGYGSYAENEICQKYSVWNPNSILDRSLQLLDFMETRWEVNLGSDDEKINLLGLDFMKPFKRINEREFKRAEKSSRAIGRRQQSAL